MSSRALPLLLSLAPAFLGLSCATTSSVKNPPPANWAPASLVLEQQQRIQTGDIVIPQKKDAFAHSLILSHRRELESFWPEAGFRSDSLTGYLELLKSEGRNLVVLRLRNRPADFQRVLMDEVAKTRDKHYQVVWDRDRTDAFYCSQWVWKVYKEAGLRTGRLIDLDTNGGKIVLPYDLLDAPDLYQLDFGPVAASQSR